MTKKIILVSIIFSLLILLFLGFLIYLQIRGIKKNSQDILSAKEESISFESRVNQLEQFKKTYSDLEPNLAKIDSLFVDPEVPVELIKFWENIAKDSGLSIEISPTIIKPNGSEPWNFLGFQLTLGGPFSNFAKFLEKIEAGPYLLEVQNLTIKKEKEETKKENISATVLVEVFTK